MHRMTSLLAVAAVAVIAAAAFLSPLPYDKDDDSWYAAETARLEDGLRHAAPGSPLAFKLQTKLERIRAGRAGQPQPGFPDEFARVLWEMRVPSDRQHPDYEPGYRFREYAKVPRAAADKSLAWQSRGPGNVAGRARGIIVDPDDPTGLTWFIAAVGGGVWKTSDGGTTWAELTDDLPNLAIQSIVMAPSNHDVIYAGTGESFYNIDTMNGNGILKTTDRGLTWTPLASTVGDPRFNNVSRIIVSPTDPDLVLCSTTVGSYKFSLYPTSHIFRSTDGGVTWTEVHGETGDPRIQQIVADPTDFSVQYAAVKHTGILKSTDAGLTWAYVNSGITDLYGRFEIAISPVNTDYVYAASQGSSHSELWVSWNGGADWHETAENGSEPNWLGSQGWYDNAIACHPTDPTKVFVGGPELWRIDLASAGSGAPLRTSTPLASYGFPHPDHHDIEIVHDGGGWWLLGTNDGGVTRTSSEDAGFTVPIMGMVTTQFYGVDKRPGASAYVGGMQDNGTWRSPVDPGPNDQWFFQVGGDGYETSWHFDDPQKIMGGYQYNGLQRSLDGGLSWSSALSGMSDSGGGSAPFITKIGKSAARPDHVFAVGVSGVWRSTDFGGSWSLSTIASGDWGPLSSFQDVRVSAADPDVVWAGSRMDVDGDILVSTDGGLTFNGTTDYTDVTMGRISGLATDPHDAATAYVLFSYAERPKILKTTDSGATWTDISGFGTGSVSTNGFPDVAVYDLMVFPNDPSKIWVGSEIGLIESTDGGANWALANNGLPAVGIWKLAAIEDEVVLATHGRGIWTVTDPALMNGSTYRPLLDAASQVPSGDIVALYTLRSAYDSTQVLVDGAVADVVGPNTVMQTGQLSIPVVSAGQKTVMVRSWKDGSALESVLKTVDAIVLGAPVTTYLNHLDVAGDEDDFLLDGFNRGISAGFSDTALHSSHWYGSDANDIAMLLKPVTLSTTTTLTFDEVALIEPGATGSAYGDWNFYDFVVVEGTVDGIEWLPLADGYDARDDADWLNTYNSSGSGDASLYRTRTISLNDTFNQGDTILLRFRLYSDSWVEGWGWVVDDVEISATGSTGVGDTPGAPVLGRNFPNPFNPSTTIAFELPRAGNAKLEVFDVKGRRVRVLADGHHAAGAHSVVWDGRGANGAEAASGSYFYRLTTDGGSLNGKMLLLK